MHNQIQDIVDQVGTVLLGKEQTIKLALCCLFARGHLLIEDLPGMGKTTLSQALAQVLGLDFKRVQFTSDLLPADILGYNIFHQGKSELEFHAGPVFTQVLLADEINRTTPKTQSALLEAMAEGQVTIDGETRSLPAPFFVIATQNPVTQSGTYPLPESQMDRFLMRINIGYPNRDAERRMFLGENVTPAEHQLERRLQDHQLADIAKQCQAVSVSDSLLDYVQRLVEHSRTDSAFAFGLSPRGALALLNASRGWAFIEGRDHVIPEDVQAVLPSVAGHRLRGMAQHQGDSAALVQQLMSQVAVIG